MATLNQKIAAQRIVEQVGKGGKVSVSKAMRGVYSPSVAKNPKKITESKGFQELLGSFLPDKKVLQRHKELLDSHRIDHMVFPLGPKDEDDPNLSGARSNNDGSDPDGDAEAAMPEEHKERTSLTDKEIIEMLAEANCKVRRIVHGETARHVYFWSPDNKARKDGIEMAYKIKGKMKGDGSGIVAVQVNINEDREKFL